MNPPVAPTQRTLPVKCGTCDRPLENPLFCQGCHTLFPREHADFFELLGLPAQYDLTPGELRRRYLELARAVHPDRFSDDAAQVRQLSERLSARINRAFEVLGDPLARADYLLERSGGKSAAQDKSVPPDVLAQALDWQEQMENHRTVGDAAALRALRTEVAGRAEALVNQVAALARRLPGDDALRRELRAALNTRRYFSRLIEQLEPGRQES